MAITPLKMAAAGVAMFTLLVTFAIQHIPGPEDPIILAVTEQHFEKAWIDAMKPLTLKKADRETIRVINLTRSTEPKPVVTERIITPAPDAAPAPPVVMVQDEEDKPPAARHRRQHAPSNVCTRHHMHKVMIRGGKSWRCRK